MSGGALTDDRYDLYRLDDWSNKVERENPLLAELMRDLGKVLHAYDYYLSGDTGEEAITKAWDKFRAKWIGVSEEEMTERVSRKAMEAAKRYVDSVTKGFDPTPKWWEVD